MVKMPVRARLFLAVTENSNMMVIVNENPEIFAKRISGFYEKYFMWRLVLILLQVMVSLVVKMLLHG